MKKIAAFGLAALMAVGATVASSDAFAKPYKNWQNNNNWQHHHSHSNSGFFFSAPLFFGLGFGPRYVNPYPRYNISSLHVQWCQARYRTYNPYSNTFFIRKGVPAVCVSPYWHG